jgi:hypothetical protein
MFALIHVCLSERYKISAGTLEMEANVDTYLPNYESKVRCTPEDHIHDTYGCEYFKSNLRLLVVWLSQGRSKRRRKTGAVGVWSHIIV